jgi:hypothetical protein
VWGGFSIEEREDSTDFEEWVRSTSGGNISFEEPPSSVPFSN